MACYCYFQLISHASTWHTSPGGAQRALPDVKLGVGARALRVRSPGGKVVQHNGRRHRHVQARGARAVLWNVHQRLACGQLAGRQPRALSQAVKQCLLLVR